jgi:hypothetical protein
MNDLVCFVMLNRYIPIEEIPVNYGGFKRENDSEFFGQDATVSEIFLKAGTTATIEIPALEVTTNVQSFMYRF